TSTVGLAVGLAIWLAVGRVVGQGDGLAFGLAAGLAAGLANRAWPAFLIASGWLAIHRRVPRGLMTFLDDAYRLGLLRVVGSAYQFRHAELQDHLTPKHKIHSHPPEH